MAARSPQHPEAGWFTTPTQVNHRRYEALRAFFVDGLTYQQAADRFGYPRWAMVNLVREWRAGRLELFVPPRKPGPPAGVAPAKQRVRGRVIQLRRQGLSTYEISARLAAEQTPLNRTRVIPATSWLLGLLALKLTRTRRVSHVDALLADPTAGLLAGLAVLPKKSALTRATPTGWPTTTSAASWPPWMPS